MVLNKATLPVRIPVAYSPADPLLALVAAAAGGYTPPVGPFNILIDTESGDRVLEDDTVLVSYT
jgi:hypothetical protein